MFGEGYSFHGYWAVLHAFKCYGIKLFKGILSSRTIQPRSVVAKSLRPVMSGSGPGDHGSNPCGAIFFILIRIFFSENIIKMLDSIAGWMIQVVTNLVFL